MNVNSILLSSEEEGQRLFAYENIQEFVREFSEFEDEAAAIFPVEMYALVKNICSSIEQMLEQFEKQMPIDNSNFKGLSTKFALLSREVIGADKITEKNLSLFSKKKEFFRLTNLNIGQFKK